MRYVIGVLLLASPAVAGEPVYSWQTLAGDPDRVYLFLDGRQVGGWDYAAKHYRPYDGATWGPPAAAGPVRPPDRRVVVVVRPQPVVVTQPLSPLPPLHGPFRVRFAAAATHVVADMTMKMVSEIPGAVVDAVKRGDYKLEYQYSVTPPAPPADGQAAPPAPAQPPRILQRRWVVPRP
jgi:hypothetical protein